MLNHDALLNVFSHCRLEDIDGWNLRLAWCKLAHVCRRWRYLIYDSSSLLDMYLFLRNDSRTLDSLAHLPPLPIVIDCCNMATTRVQRDEPRILPALQQRGRVRRIFLQLPSPRLGIFLASMNGLYPILEDLSLLSATEEEANIVLPSTFCAPNMRHLALHGLGLPSGLSLSTSATTLVTLTLTRISAPNYFHPGNLVTQLQGLLYLEELSIGFAVPIPLPSTERELLPAPRLRVALPTLKRLMFRGVAVYLENLIAQIIAPLLERLIVTLYFELSFTLVALTQLILATGGLKCHGLSAKLFFKRGGVSIIICNSESLSSGGLTVNVNCERLDWQVDAATQCCGALEKCLTAVERLTLDLDKNGTPSDWDDPLDSVLWRELLLQFGSVRKLQIGSSLVLELSDTLKSDAAESNSNLLPELQEFELHPEIHDASMRFSSFIETREREGRRVELLVPPSPERDRHVSEIRSPPGLQAFLIAPSFDALHSAVERGPVIVIGHSAWRSDIIILLRGLPPSLVPTADNFYERAKHLKDRLLSGRTHGLGSDDYEDALSSVLESLYGLVGRPVIQRLHDLNIPEQSRIWFCPTSVFCSLPLHAMGPIRSEGSAKFYLSDLYIPSYTATLSALIKPPKLRARPLGRPSVLLVIKPDDATPGIFEETGIIQSAGLATKTLIKKRATPSAVLKYLSSHRFVHISCNEISEANNPLAFFKLYEGTHLALLNIVRAGLPTAEFAFLPSCHMAELTNKSTADEELHLAGMIQYCGFQSVVGRMWAIAGVDDPIFAWNFYRSVSSDRWQGRPCYESTAETLRDAVKVLRIEKMVRLERWVNFVHYGA